MNIAELFVRLRGDTSDFDRAAGRAARGFSLIEGGARGATLQTGRLGNQFANLAGRIAGVHPVVGNLAGVMGNFAIGAGLTVGVLAGVAAVAVAYDKLTASSRKAMEAADKLTASYNQAAKISALGIGGQQKADIEIINKGLEEHAKWLGFIIAARIRLGSLGGLLGKDPGGHAAAGISGASAAAKAEQARVNAIGLATAAANEKWAAHQKELGQPAIEAARKAAAAALQASETYWRSQAQLWKSASERVASLKEEARQYLLDNPVSGIVQQAVMGNISPLDMPSIDINAGLTDEQKKQREKMGIFIDDANKNAENVQAAIWGSASQLANTLVSALNIGGGGKGSNLGGALGGTAGFAAGYYFGGPIGGAIGATIGNIAGSLFGGLFDHKKAVNSNTQAIIRLTAEIRNAPSGFKIASYRHNAAEVRELYDAVAEEESRRRSRGGATPLGMALT